VVQVLVVHVVDRADVARNPQVNIKALSAKEIDRGMAEIRFLKTLKHECLIKLFSAFSKDDRIIFITELMTSGTLHE
jgi:serine/threonine protein kinase